MAKKNRTLVKNANIRKLIQDEKDQQAKLAEKRARRKENAAAFSEILEKRKLALMKEVEENGGPSSLSASSTGIFGFGVANPSTSSGSQENMNDAMDGGEAMRKRKTVLKMLGRLSVKKNHLKPKKENRLKAREENRPGQVGKLLKERRLSEDKRDRITVQKRRLVNKFGQKVFRFRNVEPRREKLVRRQLEKRQRIGPKPPKRTASGKKRKVKISTKKRDRMNKRAQRRERKRLQKKSRKSVPSGRSGMQVSSPTPPAS